MGPRAERAGVDGPLTVGSRGVIGACPSIFGFSIPELFHGSVGEKTSIFFNIFAWTFTISFLYPSTLCSTNTVDTKLFKDVTFEMILIVCYLQRSCLSSGWYLDKYYRDNHNGHHGDSEEFHSISLWISYKAKGFYINSFGDIWSWVVQMRLYLYCLWTSHIDWVWIGHYYFWSNTLIFGWTLIFSCQRSCCFILFNYTEISYSFWTFFLLGIVLNYGR